MSFSEQPAASSQQPAERAHSERLRATFLLAAGSWKLFAPLASQGDQVVDGAGINLDAGSHGR